jgi:hypothetical protein
MGEYADMMLEGEACAGCGMPFFNNADGIPRYCSRSCEPVGWRGPKAEKSKRARNVPLPRLQPNATSRRICVATTSRYERSLNAGN